MRLRKGAPPGLEPDSNLCRIPSRQKAAFASAVDNVALADARQLVNWFDELESYFADE